MYQMLVLILLAIHGSYGDHFRGGTMSWKPIEGQNRVMLSYSVGFKMSFNERGFDPCTVPDAAAKTVLDTKYDLDCENCVSNQVERSLQYICTDYDLDQDWAIGGYTMEYDVPPGQNKFEISFEDCCWIRDIVSPSISGGKSLWQMATEVNVNPRPDGLINSSPVTAAIPLEKYYYGCTYNLQIAVSDPNNDLVKCSWMTPEECGSEKAKRCGQPTKGMTLKGDCSYEFDTVSAGKGAHAVNIMIKDCNNNKCKKPYSRIPLLFLMNVTGSGDVCMKPSIIIPPSCKTIAPNQPFEMVIIAEAGDESKPIARMSSSGKPSGMKASPMESVEGSATRMSITLSWTPTSNQIGGHTVCFSALDTDAFTSGRYCTHILVSDKPALSPDPEQSTPGPNAEHLITAEWVIRFNDQIRRPQRPAFIRIIDESGNTVSQVNTKSKDDVVISGDTMTFTPNLDDLPFNAEPVPYTVKFDEGVALPIEGGCMSDATEWTVLLKPKTYEGLLPKEHHCKAASSTGGNTCDVYVKEAVADKNGNPMLTGYDLCCSCIDSSGAPAPVGPPGSPGSPAPIGQPGRR